MIEKKKFIREDIKEFLIITAKRLIIYALTGIFAMLVWNNVFVDELNAGVPCYSIKAWVLFSLVVNALSGLLFPNRIRDIGWLFIILSSAYIFGVYFILF